MIHPIFDDIFSSQKFTSCFRLKAYIHVLCQAQFAYINTLYAEDSFVHTSTAQNNFTSFLDKKHIQTY